MKIILLGTILFFIAINSFGQWDQMGNDINGASGDKIGFLNRTSLDSAGVTIAIGSPYNSDLGTNYGYAKVLEWNGSQWAQRGDQFDGTMNSVGTGSAVSLSADGLTVAVGSSHGINSLGYVSGLVNVYDWDGTTWNLRGSTVEGEGNASPAFAFDNFGNALKLSPDGNCLAVGGSANTPEVGVLQISGHARIYHWNGVDWEQMGEDIDGVTSLEEFGHAIDINAAGNIVAIGGRSRNTAAFQEAGYVRILEWDGTNWNTRGSEFFGIELGSNLGNSLSLSKDGNTIAIGIPKANGSNGATIIFDWNGTNYIQRGTDIIGPSFGQAGTSVDLSYDGMILAVGEPWTTSAYGQTSIYEWNGTNWVLINQSIDESGVPGSLNVFGSDVCLNALGNIVSIGAFANNDSDGQVRVFENLTVVGLEGNEIKHVQYYPNPATSSLNIQATNTISSVKIINMIGQEIVSINGSTKEINVNINDLSPGNYFVEVQTNNQIEVLRFTKQ